MMAPSSTTTTQSNFWSSFRTVILVTFLAVLIWLLAESRMVQTRIVELQVVLVGNTQDPTHEFVVRPSPSEVWSASVDLELEGSLASLDEVSRELRGRVQLMVGDQIPSRVGVHELDLRSALGHLPALRTRGVSIRSLSKDVVKIEVDELIELELPVRVDLPDSVALDGPPRAIPQTITIKGPSTLIADYEDRDVIATPPPSAISALIPGRLETIPSVAINLPFASEPRSAQGWTPILTPSRVDIRLTIRSLTQNTTIDRLPVQILLAPAEVGRWQVTLNPGSEDLVAVQISGPTAALEAIGSGSIVPSAVLSLSFQDLERSISTKQIQILGLPDGVEIISEIPEVAFTISRIIERTQDPTTTTP
ncbi:MAG: hypothetical protein P1U30_01400 [Phycisphaerales bacterium]|nr:hypothetical protein [Phycisphaerales bacterium]